MIILDIKKYLKQTLEDKSILELLADKRVYFLHATAPKTPYVEYEIISEIGADWHEGKELATNYIVQVDIFSKSDYSEIELAIKKQMLNRNFIRDMCIDLFEGDTQLFHKIMRYRIDGLADS